MTLLIDKKLILDKKTPFPTSDYLDDSDLFLSSLIIIQPPLLGKQFGQEGPANQ